MPGPQTLEELEAVLNELADDVPEIVLHHTEVAANDLMALVDLRVTETGIDRNGSPFKKYTKPYEERKKKLGRFRGIVDFQLTQEMMESTGTGLVNIVPVEKTSNGPNCIVVIGPRDEITRKKIEGNDKSRPGFLLPSDKEVERVSNIREEALEQEIKERFQ